MSRWPGASPADASPPAAQGVLENVKVRTEAFDYLQLPFDIDEGSIGRLQIPIPWGQWRSGPLKIELSGVTLRATARDETDWEEGPARRRAQAAKQAELASAELEKLSKRVAQAGLYRLANKSRWSVAEYVSTYLLNSLQLSIKDVHVYFKVGGPCGLPSPCRSWRLPGR